MRERKLKNSSGLSLGRTGVRDGVCVAKRPRGESSLGARSLGSGGPGERPPPGRAKWFRMFFGVAEAKITRLKLVPWEQVNDDVAPDVIRFTHLATDVNSPSSAGDEIGLKSFRDAFEAGAGASGVKAKQSVSLPTASLFLQAGSLCFVVLVSILILCKVFGSRRRVGIEEEGEGRPREPAAAAVERARRRRKKRRDRVVEEWDKLLDAALESGAL